jgi:hypothetical protein
MKLCDLPDSVKLLVLKNLSQPGVLTDGGSLLRPFNFAPNGRVAESAIFSSSVLEALHASGVAVVDGIAGVELTRAVLEELKNLRSGGEMKQAGMTVTGKKWTEKSVRGDFHMWLKMGDSKLPPNLQLLLLRLDEIAGELRKSFPAQASSIKSLQAQATCYPGNDAGYARHLDASAVHTKKAIY